MKTPRSKVVLLAANRRCSTMPAEQARSVQVLGRLLLGGRFVIGGLLYAAAA